MPGGAAAEIRLHPRLFILINFAHPRARSLGLGRPMLSRNRRNECVIVATRRIVTTTRRTTADPRYPCPRVLSLSSCIYDQSVIELFIYYNLLGPACATNPQVEANERERERERKRERGGGDMSRISVSP